jgi:uncharacterized protein
VTLKPSFYNHYTELGDGCRTILFNKSCGSVAVVDRAQAKVIAGSCLDGVPADQIGVLESSGFLVAKDVDEQVAARERYQRRKASNSLLGVTIELTQECNLACTFCYQNSYRGTGAITDKTVDRVDQYIVAVVTDARRPIREVALRFIGGEPLMQKEKVLQAIRKIRSTTEIRTWTSSSSRLSTARSSRTSRDRRFRPAVRTRRTTSR